MSFDQQALERRAARIEELSTQGDMDVEHFMSFSGFAWADLVTAGVLRPKRLYSTDDFVAYEPTSAGREYLKAFDADDLLMVRRGKVAVLLAYCHKVLRH